MSFPGEKVALAHACFHLGQALYQRGNRREGKALIEKAVELHPDSWNFFRQMKNLEDVNGSFGEAFFQRVLAFMAEGKVFRPDVDMPHIREYLATLEQTP